MTMLIPPPSPDARRTENLQCMGTPELRDAVDAFARERRWSRSTAIEQLIIKGLQGWLRE